MKASRIILTGIVLATLAQFNSAALACEACFGRSDSPMAHAVNAGILTLLGIIGTVLCGAATFFVFLARRASAVGKIEEKNKI